MAQLDPLQSFQDCTTTDVDGATRKQSPNPHTRVTLESLARHGGSSTTISVANPPEDHDAIFHSIASCPMIGVTSLNYRLCYPHGIATHNGACHGSRCCYG